MLRYVMSYSRTRVLHTWHHPRIIRASVDRKQYTASALRIVNIWNSLSNQVVDVTNVNCFSGVGTYLLGTARAVPLSK